jgi:RND family efflux transporter MFP subunit
MKKGPLFKSSRVLIVLFAAILIAAVLVSLRPKAARQVPVETGRLVEVFPAKSENLQMVVEAYGTVEPREALILVAQVQGQIVAIDPGFVEGGFVRRTTTLIQIDPRTYKLEVDRRNVQIKQAEAELKRLEQEILNLRARIKIAQSDLALAKNEYQRLRQLIDRKVIAQSTLDKTEQQYLLSLERLQALENQMALTGPQKEQLIAQRDMARVLFEQAKLDLEHAAILTPFDGWVLEKAVEVGQHVNVGQTLGRIYRAGELDIEVQIPVKDFKWLPDFGNHQTAVAADVVFKNAGKHHIWAGRVARIKAQMDQRTRTLPVIVEVNEAVSPVENQHTLRLRPGMFVTVEIKGRQMKQVFVLPRHLVYPDDVVYTVEGNRLKVKSVKVLRAYKDSVIVSEGLTEGDLIIKTPLSAVTDGMLVRVK